MGHMDNYGQLFNEAVASQIRAERAAAGMTVAELVAASGLSKSKVLRLIHAQRDIDARDIALITRALGMEPALLIQRAQARLQASETTIQG